MDAFGAEGDGETDDADAIQAAADSVDGLGVLAFSAGREYLVSESTDIDVESVRGIMGRNATILLDEDVAAFDIEGEWMQTSNPDDTDGQMGGSLTRID